MIWNCGKYKIEYGEKVLIMGIVNVTPDSFSDGGDNFSVEKAVETALQMEKEGADMIDIGGQSTRPGHIPISAEEEWERLEPVLNALNGKMHIPISVDTFYPYVAEKAVKLGVSIINDVSGNINDDMANVVKNSNIGWILMHNGAGDVAEVKEFFKNTANQLERLGINQNQICFDMGIGFGKTRQQDMSLISNISAYKLNGYPLLLGTSRKRVIKEGTRQENPKLRIYGNIAADTVAILGGVDVIRLHDVANEKQGIYMAEALKNNLK